MTPFIAIFQYCRFSPVPRAAVLRGLTVILNHPLSQSMVVTLHGQSGLSAQGNVTLVTKQEPGLVQVHLLMIRKILFITSYASN